MRTSNEPRVSEARRARRARRAGRARGARRALRARRARGARRAGRARRARRARARAARPRHGAPPLLLAPLRSHLFLANHSVKGFQRILSVPKDKPRTLFRETMSPIHERALSIEGDDRQIC